MTDTLIKGKITEIIENGTIVSIIVKNKKSKFEEVINMEHRPFQWLIDSEGNNLIGRDIEYDGEQIYFMEDN